jgi:hypothetical protein
MLENISKLNLVRIGSYITYSSLKKIGNDLLESFSGIIGEVDLSHHDSPMIDSIDAQLLTLILGEDSIIGGKNLKNDVAVVSTNKLTPRRMESDEEIDRFIDRTTKVALHEVGHNFGLTDHASFKPAPDGALCPMSRGEFNKFGYRGYVRAIVDGRGLKFCDECSGFLSSIYGYRPASKGLVRDGLVSATN